MIYQRAKGFARRVAKWGIAKGRILWQEIEREQAPPPQPKPPPPEPKPKPQPQQVPTHIWKMPPDAYQRAPENYAIKPGYRSRNMQPQDIPHNYTGTIYQPDVYHLAAYLARQYGAEYLIDVGCRRSLKLIGFHPEFKLIGIDLPTVVSYNEDNYNFGQWIGFDFNRTDYLDLPPEVLAKSVIICSDVIEHLEDPGPLLANLSRWMAHSPAAVLSTPERDLRRGMEHMGPPNNTLHVREWNRVELQTLLQAYNLNVLFKGLTVSDTSIPERKTSLAILGKNDGIRPTDPAPDEFRVVALMSAYMEADIIAESIEHCIAQGLEVYVLDNWSTDGTAEIARRYIGQGVIAVEQFPPEGRKYHDWEALLDRKAALSQELNADWFIHYDADELRESPWRGVSLRDAFYYVDRLGFNAVNHTVLNFFPVDDEFESGMSMCEYFRHFYLPSRPVLRLQIKAWKATDAPLNLSESGGHKIKFPHQRVYPYRFLMRHYPLRGREQALRKIHERQTQIAPAARERGWHGHYNHYDPEDEATFDKICQERQDDALVFDETFYDTYLIERLTALKT